jgi:DNA-damage-inducible protein J
MAFIQIRTDDDLKKAAQSQLKSMGLSLSSAMNLFLRHIAIVGTIPFPITSGRVLSKKEERALIQDMEDALQNSKGYDSVDELFEDILNE